MSTTKPDTDTGWSKEFPTADGYYWMRFAPDDRCPMPVRYDNGYMHEIGVADDMRWVRDTEKAEFLPASPSDFEQLIRLRKSAGDAQSWIAVQAETWTCQHADQPMRCSRCSLRQKAAELVAALREALAHTGEKS